MTFHRLISPKFCGCERSDDFLGRHDAGSNLVNNYARDIDRADGRKHRHRQNCFSRRDMRNFPRPQHMTCCLDIIRETMRYFMTAVIC